MRLVEVIIERIFSHPLLFDIIRRIVENDFRGEKRAIQEELDLDGCRRVLDVGCGTGELFPLFRPENYVGIDISGPFIAHASKKYDGRFHVMDGRHLAFADNSFDDVLVAGLFHHFPDDYAHLVLQEIKRVTRPMGTILIMEDVMPPSKFNILGEVVRRLDVGGFIRSAEQYNHLFTEHFGLRKRYPIRSGVCDYVVLVLVNNRDVQENGTA